MWHGLSWKGALAVLPYDIMVENVGRHLAPGKKGTVSAQEEEISADGCLPGHPEAMKGYMGGYCDSFETGGL